MRNHKFVILYTNNLVNYLIFLTLAQSNSICQRYTIFTCLTIRLDYLMSGTVCWFCSAWDPRSLQSILNGPLYLRWLDSMQFLRLTERSRIVRQFVTVDSYFTFMVIDNLVYKLRVTNSVQYMLEGAAPLGASESLRERNSQILSASQVLFGTFPFVPTFLCSIFRTTLLP